MTLSPAPAASAFPLPATTLVTRTEHGVIAADYGTALYKGLKAGLGIAGLAASRRLIPGVVSTIARDRTGAYSGEAVVHEVYDVAADGTAALVCVRRSVGSAFGVGTVAKDYYLISYLGTANVTVATMPKLRVAKVAKASPRLGMAISHLLAEVATPRAA